VRFSVEINGRLKTYEGLNIEASGTKFANANQNECEIKVTNMDKATRDYILTETSIFNANRTKKRMILEAGRVSTGYATVYVGDIAGATIGQPPDITLTLKGLTGKDAKGKGVSKSQPSTAKLKNIAAAAAKDMGVTLDFQAKDKDISNYAYTGGAAGEVDELGNAGEVDAYLDDDKLIVKDQHVALTGKMRVLNIDTGMIGIPEITEKGIKVKFLLDNVTTLGGGLKIESVLNPAINGVYVIYKLGFEIASRDTPFYWIAEAIRT
jgi:hypothetical protein